MSDQHIEENIDVMLVKLSAPLSPSEISDGWTSQSKLAVKTFFEGLKQKLQSGEPLPPLSISRSLDHWGVVSGEMLELAAKISNQIRAR